MSIQVNATATRINIADKPKSTPEPVTSTAQTVPEEAKQDIVNLSNSLEKMGKGSLSVLTGMGVGTVLSTTATSGLASFVIPNASKQVGTIVHSSLRISLAPSLAGAAASTLLSDNATSGAVIGAVAGGLANMTDALGGNRIELMISAAIGAVAGGVGGYTAAKVKQHLQD